MLLLIADELLFFYLPSCEGGTITSLYIGDLSSFVAIVDNIVIESLELDRRTIRFRPTNI